MHDAIHLIKVDGSEGHQFYPREINHSELETEIFLTMLQHSHFKIYTECIKLIFLDCVGMERPLVLKLVSSNLRSWSLTSLKSWTILIN